MKKISVIVLLLIIFNFIWSNFAYAVTETVQKNDDTSVTMDIDEYKSIADDGKATIGGSKMDISLKESDVGSGTSKFGIFLTSICASGLKVISDFVCEGEYFYHTDSEYSASQTGLFTISSLIFDEFLIFNTEVYQTSSDLYVGSGEPTTAGGPVSSVDSIKVGAVTISKTITTISVLLAIPMIIYAIIKALLSRKAADLAAWKKILTRWIICFLLILGFQFLFIAVDTASDTITNALYNIRLGMEESDYKSFEVTTLENTVEQYENTGGVISLAYALVFVALFVVQVLFLIKYVIRTFAIIALFMLAPLIILLHSFNLMLGKESDILANLFKKYIALTFMQPIHALFYLIFFFSLSEIAINVPILGILLLYALYRAESISKAMFGWDLGLSIFSSK